LGKVNPVKCAAWIVSPVELERKIVREIGRKIGGVNIDGIKDDEK
jgi:hypothetical protein